MSDYFKDMTAILCGFSPKYQRNQSMNKKSRLTQGKIGKTLFQLTIPMLLATISMVIFNLADTFFIGRLGTLPLAALAFTFPVVFVITSLALGLGIGVSALVSRAIGEGDHHKVQCLTTASLILALILVFILAAIGLITLEPIFRALGANENVLPLIKDYMNIWYGGVLFVVVPMVGNNAIRATGDTKTPGLVMAASAIFNLLFDPLLIYGIGPFPELGIRGAAYATVAARFITFIFAVYILYHREKMIAFHDMCIKNLWKWWKRILYIGLPTAGSRMIIPVAVAIITRLISKYGDHAVAGFGVASRIEFFALVGVMSLASVLGPFIGQNLGAQKMHRVQKSYMYSNYFSIVSGLLIALVLAVFSKDISAVFNANQSVVSISSLYLMTVPISYTLLGVSVLSMTTLNVLHKPLIATLLSIIHMFVIYVPLAHFLSSHYDIQGIFLALAIANGLIGVGGYFIVKREIRLVRT